MKIISKYKDFYDFIVQDHDADITYVRDMNIISGYYDDLFKRDGNGGIPYYNKYYGYSDYYSKNYAAGELELLSVIFGIYPYVYSQPILKMHYKTITDIMEYDYFVLSKDIIDDTKEGKYDKLFDFAQSELNKKVNNNRAKYIKVSFPEYYRFKPYKIGERIKELTWIVECKEIFNKIEAPVFIKYYDWLFDGGAYWEKIWNTPRNVEKHYIINISFQKLNMNILKYWYDELNTVNTYINIENFLWSIKQEPIANPDNNTKILSHGFDLKTSFRKM